MFWIMTPLDLLKSIKIGRKQEQNIKPINPYPKECSECGGWIEFKSTKFGKFYVCEYCKWSCTGTGKPLKYKTNKNALDTTSSL